ncbi:MAG TPA: allantoate amidohydrolase [Terrimesophilobacter sp.]|nr:allantoate amidohydrolase [Terrimesophilobacter sp.]
MTVVALLDQLTDIGRNPASGGYDRSAWTAADSQCRDWFRQQAQALGLDTELDRNGNLWAWWRGEASGTALVLGSHLDSVPSGGAFDGPLGIASAFAAIGALQKERFTPTRPVAVVAFADEEGARFGVACTGSRLMTGALNPDSARGLVDVDGIALPEAMAAAGADATHLGADPERLARVGEFIELHIEQGHLPTGGGAHGLTRAGSPLGLATGIWPHGRWRIDIAGQQNHAGTTPLADRADPMLGLAAVIVAVRAAAEAAGALATVGKVAVHPGAVNAIPGRASAWIDARAADEYAVRRVIDDVVGRTSLVAVEESWTAQTPFDTALVSGLADQLLAATGRDLPRLPSGAGHDAGVLALAGVPSAMILVRNPTGISHAPEEFADDADCAAGVTALAAVIRARAGQR